jgi:lipoate-protein ligase A
MRLLHLHNYPIYEQLQIEEALLRSDQDNWCLINEGTAPAIVMGISGKPEEFLELDAVRRDQIAIVKRFSGGGTVFVDEETLFITFICQKALHPELDYPHQIMRWAEELLSSSLSIEGFHLKENDFVIGNHKCGGNAQYLKKDRFLHHTSMLYNFNEKNMRYLLHPKKTPAYRQNRSHTEFLCKLRDHLPQKQEFALRIKRELMNRYPVVESGLTEVLQALERPHRKMTLLIG